MNRKLKRTHVVLLVLAVVTAAAASSALKPSGAMATAPATVVQFKDAPLSAKLREIAGKVASRHGVAMEGLIAVAPTAGGPHFAGVFVGRNAAGDDVVAPYNADDMMGFVGVDRISGYGGVVVFASEEAP